MAKTMKTADVTIMTALHLAEAAFYKKQAAQLAKAAAKATKKAKVAADLAQGITPTARKKIEARKRAKRSGSSVHLNGQAVTQ